MKEARDLGRWAAFTVEELLEIQAGLVQMHDFRRDLWIRLMRELSKALRVHAEIEGDE